MKIFEELKKLGYKHYTEHTVEELDNLPLNSEERVMEQALVLRWFREKYGYDVSVKKCTPSEYKFEIEQLVADGDNYYFIDFIFSSHEEAELACLRKLIEIVKQKS